MKTLRSAIHKLTVQADCGCIAWGEYQDEACKRPASAITFTPCEKHKEAAGIDLAEKFMKEAVLKEAADTKIAPPPAPAPTEPPAHLDGDAAARRAARVAASTVPAAEGSSTSAVRPPTSAVPAQAGTATRTPITSNAKPGAPRPGSGQPRVIGGTPGGVRRHDPTNGRTANGLKVAGKAPGSGGGSIAMDMDGVAEDKRVTNLIELSGALDVDDDDGDIEFD